MKSALQDLVNEIVKLPDGMKIYIPGLWENNFEKSMISVDYKNFLLNQIGKIKDRETDFSKPLSFTQPKTKYSDHWSSSAVVYNILARYFTAFDHNADGKLGQSEKDITTGENGIRETGTFVKTIALLPYLKKLGINTIHLLPITTIGKSGRKGDLGSPYAIKNPYEIEATLSDPLINLPIETQFKALVEAAHRLNIRVVVEFIFRTSAKDADWITEHPEWFYWIDAKADYHAPEFDKEDLKEILQVPKNKGRHIPPPVRYRDHFMAPPTKNTIFKEGDDYKANENGKILKIAGAFADWPPNDLQPPWTDVTYLKLFNYDLHESNNFNYIAYNTIRFYDPRLTKEENINRPLWELISNIIPHFQKEYGIDGAMIDMGHALPDALKSMIIKNAREYDQDFAFWDENFDNTIKSKNSGYDAVIGNCWYTITKRNGFNRVIKDCLKEKPLLYFGASETHNTPRFSPLDLQKKKSAWLLFNILPGSIPFIHNGFELCETLPVNTGLNFTKKEVEIFSKQPLPLFYKASMQWDSKRQIIDFISALDRLKNKHPKIFDRKHLQSIQGVNKRIATLVKGSSFEVIFVFNLNFRKKESCTIELPKGYADRRYSDLLSEKTFDTIGQHLKIDLKKGEFLILKCI